LKIPKKLNQLEPKNFSMESTRLICLNVIFQRHPNLSFFFTNGCFLQNFSQ